MEPRVVEVIAAHRAAGRTFEAAGVGSFVRSEGDGDPIVLMHGLPSSSFLYRKVLPELARRGFAAVSFDLPGLGLADRPVDFDYSFVGLSRFAVAAVDALGLDRFHLVVHDAGGPVGFEVAAAAPDRVRSLTILNTVVAMDAVPFPMEIYARFASGRSWSAAPPRRMFRAIFYAVGVNDRSAVSPVEVDAYRELVVRVDGGAAYLQIMRNMRRGARDHSAVVDSRSVPYPVQIIWGANDRILPLRRHGWKALSAAALPAILTVPGKHYLQEDHAPQLGELIASFTARA
jgi:pimeloyl-ACP methyl ester carboxylesterase